MFTLSAANNPLFASSPTSSESTTVKYEAEHEIFLWRRTSTSAWQKENLIAGAISAQQAAELESAEPGPLLGCEPVISSSTECSPSLRSIRTRRALTPGGFSRTW